MADYTASAARAYIFLDGAYAGGVQLSCIGDTYSDPIEAPTTGHPAAFFTRLKFGNNSGYLLDITNVPYLYTSSTSVGLGNLTGGIVLDATAWRPAIAGTFSLGTTVYPFASATITGTIKWGNYTILPPPGGAPTFLRSDGVWAVP